jgi:pimeloyl-ACP methyl ester carboxylesterase
MVEPFYFESSGRRLFGVYSPPSVVGPHSQCGIVVCAPLGQEQIRSHRALVVLAEQLAREGFHVLRFDYGGTGDSAGAELVDVAQCCSDIRAAAEELLNVVGIERLGLLGLRVGALLAAQVASSLVPDVLLLWEPIASGEEYLRELRERNLAWWRASAIAKSSEDVPNLLGFAFPASFRASLALLELDSVARPPATRLAVVGDRHLCDCPVLQRVCANWQITPAHIESQQFWLKEEDASVSPLVPHGALSQVAACTCQIFACRSTLSC